MDITGDAGVQNERTALAWRRTSLSVLAAVLVAARVTASGGPPAALVAFVVALPAAAWLLAGADRRYGAAAAALRSAGARALPDGRLPAVLTAVVTALGTGELLHLLGQPSH